MYAIVDIAGQQFKVEKDKKVYINRIKGEVGSKVDLTKVLFIDNEKETKVGSPYLKDACVTGKILAHLKDKKVKVFKKKRRKGYKVLNGHRQYLTELFIEDISEKKIAREASSEKATSVKEPVKKKTPEKEAPKKTTVTKPAGKVTTGKKASGKQAGTKPASAKKVSTTKKETEVKKSASIKPANKTVEPDKKKTATKAKPADSKKSKDRETN